MNKWMVLTGAQHFASNEPLSSVGRLVLPACRRVSWERKGWGEDDLARMGACFSYPTARASPLASLTLSLNL